MASRQQYKSQLEAKVIPPLLRLGGTYEKLEVPYVSRRKYRPDVSFPNGVNFELKGYLDADDRRKMLEVQAGHPTLDVRFVFQRSKTKLNKKSKTTYGMWATKHGFLWCEASDFATMRRWAKEPNETSIGDLL